MKKICAITSIIIILMILSCKIKITDVKEIPVDIFETKEDNIQLAKDLISYDYKAFLDDSKINFDLNDYSAINIGYSIRTEDDKVYYQVKFDLKNIKIAQYKNLIFEKIKNKINQLIKIHQNKKNDFNNSQIIAIQWLDIKDNGKFDVLWKKTSPVFKKNTNQKIFIDSLKNSNKLLGKIINRNLNIRQFSQTLNTPTKKIVGNFILIQFLSQFEKKTVYETITLIKTDKDWVPIGYDLR